LVLRIQRAQYQAPSGHPISSPTAQIDAYAPLAHFVLRLTPDETVVTPFFIPKTFFEANRHHFLDWFKWRFQMTAVVQALSRFGGANVETETLKLLAIFCGAGFAVSIVFATYGLDLSPGFF
jgi:hypothetical protein